MSLSLREINLYSIDPAKLFHFLSFIFDLPEAETEDEDIIFTFEGIRFRILNQTNDFHYDLKCPFVFSVSEPDYFFNLRSSLEFYKYKESSQKISWDDDINQITFTDVDGREWVIKSQTPYRPNVSSPHQPYTRM